jgi:hypothetical protein
MLVARNPGSLTDETSRWWVIVVVWPILIGAVDTALGAVDPRLETSGILI